MVQARLHQEKGFLNYKEEETDEHIYKAFHCPAQMTMVYGRSGFGIDDMNLVIHFT